MIRGVRGAITIHENTEEDIVKSTKLLLEEMISQNDLEPEYVSHIWFTATSDIDAVFPAKAVRSLEGWQFVPVMCAKEIDVKNSLPKCIRIMLQAEIDKAQKDVQHVYLRDAKQLRPDLVLTKKN
ncbi:chorismate mutase [Alteribacillus persepolensis]|uniref:chorismate mutase n=1 Tax=Alteribacillus persepolensis TaxID=568899 RepID=A0A1G7ZFN7_9BACI|nr:chorismate mutase [Alteribacillus persepolensis]SDH07562.1 chorismate mutase [Alteribacillus persepolensis]